MEFEDNVFFLRTLTDWELVKFGFINLGRELTPLESVLLERLEKRLLKEEETGDA